MTSYRGVCAIFIAALAAGGCQHVTSQPELPRQDHYYVSPSYSPASLGKVAILEPANHTTYPAASERLLAVLSEQIGKRYLFAVQPIERTNPLWKRLNLDKMDTPNLKLFAQLRKELGVDAIVSGALMQYRSFPHLQITLKMRMFDLRSGQVIWGLEDVWDSSDKELEKRIQKYYKEVLRGGFEPMGYSYILTSPQAFERFVAYEVAATFPKP